MKKVTYSLTGIDEDGEQVLDIEISPDTAAQMLLLFVEKGHVEIHTKGMEISGPTALPSPIAPVKRKYKKRKPTFAKSEIEAPIDTLRKGSKRLGGARFSGHDCCGAKGARHFAWCKNVGKKGVSTSEPAPQSEETVKERAPRLSNSQFEEIRKAMNDKEFQSGKYSLVNKVPLSEVNRAVRASSVADYHRSYNEETTGL